MIASTVEPVSTHAWEQAPADTQHSSHLSSGADAANSADARANHLECEPPVARPQSVLLVDDDPIMHAIVKATLAADKLAIYTVSESETSLELAARLQPDLILLDVDMPHVDGFEICASSRPKRSPHKSP